MRKPETTERKTININGVCLSYLEQNAGAAPTVFWIHGNSGSAAAWQKQIEATKLSPFRLVAFDLPGHGRSGPIPATAAILFDIAAILAAAVEKLSNGGPFVLAGLSLGTNLVAEMLAKGIQPAGVVLIGPCILGSGYTLLNIGLEGADLSPLFSEKASPEAIKASVKAACLTEDPSVIRQLLDDYRATLPALRPAFLQAGLQEQYSDAIALLKKADLPMLVIFGEDEKLIDPHYLDGAGLPLWQEKVFRIQGGSHFIQLDRPAEVNALLLAYLKEVTAGIPAGWLRSRVP